MRLFLLFILILPVSIVARPQPDFPFVYVSGEAELEVLATHADISLDIEIEAQQAAEGRKRFGEAVNQIIEICKKQEIEIFAKSTLSKRRRENLSIFSQSLILKCEDLKQYPALAEKLTEMAAVTSYSVEFGSRETESVKHRLRTAAIRQAQIKAEGMARAVGACLKSAHAVSEAEFSAMNSGKPEIQPPLFAIDPEIPALHQPPEKITVTMRLFVLYHIVENARGGHSHP